MSALLRWLWRGLLAAPLLFLLLFFAYPLLSILQISLWPDGVLDWSGFADIISRPYYRETLAFTVFQATLSTLLTLTLALPGAYVVVRYRFPGRALLMSLATLPFVLPTVVVAAAFDALLGERGLVNDALMSLLRLPEAPLQIERTLVLILIAHVFYNYAIALRMIAGYWANQSPRMEEAARVLGAHGWRLWWFIRWPVLRPALLAAALLVFIFTFTSFGIVLILGGPRFATVEVQIYYQALNLFNLPMAAALSLVQIGIMFAMMLAYTRLQKRMSVDLQAAARIARPARTPRDRLVIGANLIVMGGLLFAPLLALVWRSLSFGLDAPGLDHYLGLTQNPRQSVLFVPPTQAIGNSLVFAALTTLLALSLGVLAAQLIAGRGRGFVRYLDPLFMLPLATSAVTLGFGFIVALDEPPLNLRGSWLIVPIAHTLVALPFVVRSVLPALRAIPPRLREAARVLGAPPVSVWRYVDLPLMSRGLVVGATFAFTVSMGEFGASLFVVRPETPTMPVVMFRLLNTPAPANYGQALALGVLLMAVCAVAFLLIERLRDAGIGEF